MAHGLDPRDRRLGHVGLGQVTPEVGDVVAEGVGGTIVRERVEQGDDAHLHATGPELVDDGRPEWLRLDYDAAGLPRRSTDPPLGDEGRGPLSPAEIQGALDPLGAILSLLLQGGACEGSATIFDGRRRFDVTLADRGAGTLKASAYNIYSGPVHECAVALEPLGGFRRSGRDLEAFPRSLTLFLGDGGPGRLPLPVRMESDTALGALIIHLVEAEGF